MSRDDVDEPGGPIPEAPVLLQLAGELAEQLAERYRTDTESAYATILELWQKNRNLREQAAKDPDPQRLKRTRAYKQAADQAKTTTYYRLRTYKQDPERLAAAVNTLRELHADGPGASEPRALAARDAIVRCHTSTSERLSDIEAFFGALFEQVPEPTSVLDVGCGVQPLLYPFGGAGRATTQYLGLDRDRPSVDAVNAWGNLIGGERLRARCWSLSDGFAGVDGPEPDGGFALAVALKLIPVLARQSRELLPLFQDLPARRLLVTGAREAMVKRRNIERRERASLLAFADELGFEVLSTFETDSELGLLLGRE